MVTVVWKLWDMKRLQLIDRKIIDQTVGKQTSVSVELRTKHSIVDSILPQISECFNPLWFKTRSVWEQIYNKKH